MENKILTKEELFMYMYENKISQLVISKKQAVNIFSERICNNILAYESVESITLESNNYNSLGYSVKGIRKCDVSSIGEPANIKKLEARLSGIIWSGYKLHCKCNSYKDIKIFLKEMTKQGFGCVHLHYNPAHNDQYFNVKSHIDQIEEAKAKEKCITFGFNFNPNYLTKSVDSSDARGLSLENWLKIYS